MSASSAGDRPTTGSPESLDSAILSVLMDNIPDRIYFKDLQSRFVRNNAAHAHYLGVNSPADCVRKSDADFFSPQHAERAFADEQEIIRTGRPMIAKIERLTMRDGKQSWASTTKMPWRDAAGRVIGTFGLTRDVTAAKDAEEKLLEERNLLRTIIDHLPSRLYVKDTQSRYVLNNRAHLDALGVKTQAEATGHSTLEFFPGERGRQALADDRQVVGGTPILSQERTDFGPEGDVHWALTTKVPLHDVRGQLVGIVGISHDITWRKKAEQELQRRSQEMETDLLMARQVQEAFLTRADPIFPRGVPAADSALRFAHRYIPTTTLGGDFFDIIPISDHQCGVLICDVMGHGVRAGLLTALIRGVVEEMGERAADPSHVLGGVNHCLMPIVERTGQPVFATVFFGLIDLRTQTLDYGSAGHPAQLVVRAASGEITRLVLPDPEPAAGLIADFAYSRRQCEFRPGDLFFGYTDGLLEATDKEGLMLGEERLRDALGSLRGRPVAEICDRLLEELRRYRGESTFADDVCLVAVEATPPGGTAHQFR